jgi:uncharacterized protein (DUF927 family)
MEFIDERSKTQNRVGFRRKQNSDDGEAGAWEYLILPEAWKAEVCKGFNAARIADEMIKRKLMRQGELRKNGKHRPKVVVRVPGEKSQRYYIVSPSDSSDA